MIMKKTIIIAAIIVSCTHLLAQRHLQLVDLEATAETKALYANLWVLQQKGFMFGHHDDLNYGRHWYGIDGKSDTKDVCVCTSQ